MIVDIENNNIENVKINQLKQVSISDINNTYDNINKILYNLSSIRKCTTDKIALLNKKLNEYG